MRAISKNTRKATAITLAAALIIAVYLPNPNPTFYPILYG